MWLEVELPYMLVRSCSEIKFNSKGNLGQSKGNKILAMDLFTYKQIKNIK